MSMAWKVTVTAVLFAVAAVAAVILIVNLLGTPPTVELLGRQFGTGERHPADGRDLRLGQPSDLGVLPRPVS